MILSDSRRKLTMWAECRMTKGIGKRYERSKNFETLRP